jgi:hypothetical protein
VSGLRHALTILRSGTPGKPFSTLPHYIMIQEVWGHHGAKGILAVTWYKRKL